MHVSDHRGPLRTRNGGEQRVTPLELFFDLVYVFAVTQLSHRLRGVAASSDCGLQRPRGRLLHTRSRTFSDW